MLALITFLFSSQLILSQTTFDDPNAYKNLDFYQSLTDEDYAYLDYRYVRFDLLDQSKVAKEKYASDFCKNCKIIIEGPIKITYSSTGEIEHKNGDKISITSLKDTKALIVVDKTGFKVIFNEKPESTIFIPKENSLTIDNKAKGGIILNNHKIGKGKIQIRKGQFLIPSREVITIDGIETLASNKEIKIFFKEPKVPPTRGLLITPKRVSIYNSETDSKNEIKVNFQKSSNFKIDEKQRLRAYVLSGEVSVERFGHKNEFKLKGNNAGFTNGDIEYRSDGKEINFKLVSEKDQGKESIPGTIISEDNLINLYEDNRMEGFSCPPSQGEEMLTGYVPESILKWSKEKLKISIEKCKKIFSFDYETKEERIDRYVRSALEKGELPTGRHVKMIIHHKDKTFFADYRTLYDSWGDKIEGGKIEFEPMLSEVGKYDYYWKKYMLVIENKKYLLDEEDIIFIEKPEEKEKLPKPEPAPPPKPTERPLKNMVKIRIPHPSVLAIIREGIIAKHDQEKELEAAKKRLDQAKKGSLPIKDVLNFLEDCYSSGLSSSICDGMVVSE